MQTVWTIDLCAIVGGGRTRAYVAVELPSESESFREIPLLWRAIKRAYNCFSDDLLQEHR